MARREKTLDTIAGAVSGPPTRSRTADLGVLALRLGVGGLMAGHGAQKLFGYSGGYGLAGTAGWLESLGLRPGKAWAITAGASEFGGGALIALGLGGPIGPIAMQGAMATAARQAHWGKPIWGTAGGAETPALYALSGAALALTGPGRFSLDRALGFKVRPAVALLTIAGTVAGVMITESQTKKFKASQPTADAPADPPADATAASAPTYPETSDASDTSLEDGASLGEDIVVIPPSDETTESVVI